MNMQGVKNQQISSLEYIELKSILKAKNSDILPELESVVIETNLQILNEKDAETKLLEPVLLGLGFKEKDWIRQLPVRMGRGERNYPDYALLVDKTSKHEETARYLWEAKYRICNENELRQSFLQAKSYARRLNSKAFGLVAVEGIWICRATHNFDFEKLEKYSWQDLQQSELYSKLKNTFKI